MTSSNRERLQQRREALRGLFARFKAIALTLQNRGYIECVKGSNGYKAKFGGWYSNAETSKLLKDFFALQTNIAAQSFTLLELEHSIDQAEAIIKAQVQTHIAAT